MNLKSPSKVIPMEGIRRYCGGKPPIQCIGWFRDHLYWHRNAIISGDHISYTLDEEDGPKKSIVDGVEKDATGIKAPRFGCPTDGMRINTLATVKRNELIFRYNHGDLALPGYPFEEDHFEPTPRFFELIKKILDYVDELHQPGIADHMDLLALELLTEVMVSRGEKEQHNQVDQRIYRIATVISTRFDEELDIESLACSCGFSRVTFYREWRKYSDVPPYRMLLENRLKTAADFLATTFIPVKEIAARCGFHSPLVFTQCFKSRFECSPREYRKLMCGADGAAL